MIPGYDAWRTACPPEPRCCECGGALPDEGGLGRDGDLCGDCVPRCEECSEPMLSAFWRECDACAEDDGDEVAS